MGRGAAPDLPENELARLLTGDDVWQDLALPQRLFAGCTASWAWLGEKAVRLTTLPFGEPLSMAVIAASTASLDPPPERLKWMRPLHAVDARQATGDPLALCRLVLHETLPAGLRDLKSNPVPWNLAELASEADRLVAATAVHLQRAAEPWLTPGQGHDLDAIAWTYRAIAASWSTDFDAAETHLQAARDELEQGSGDGLPWGIWHTGAALRERLVALAAGPERFAHLHNALAHLAAAADRLPNEGTEVERAELAHDAAQIHLALDDPPAAVESLDAAWRLVTEQEATAGYLASITRHAQVQAALAMAEAQPLRQTRQDWTLRAAAYLEDVQAFGLLAPEEWTLEARQIARCLEDLDAEPAPSAPKVTAH